jgi:hypothetical protein
MNRLFSFCRKHRLATRSSGRVRSALSIGSFVVLSLVAVNTSSYADATANTAGATDQTFRTIVKPDLWGNVMRFRFSNVFGTQPVTFNKVTVALQEYSGNIVPGTVTVVTFGGEKSVIIPVGQEIFSDGIRLRWVKDADDPALQGRNLERSGARRQSEGAQRVYSQLRSVRWGGRF